MHERQASNVAGRGSATPRWKIALAWAVVLIPLAWGLSQTLMKASLLFR